jgi:hypothetical protein
LVSFIFLSMARESGRSDGSLLNDLEQFLDDGAIHGKRAREKSLRKDGQRVAARCRSCLAEA